MPQSLRMSASCSLYESESTSGNAMLYKDLKKPAMPFKLLAEGYEYEYRVVDNINDNLLVETNYKAPRKMLVLMDPDHPTPDHWKTIIPEQEDVLERVEVAGNSIVSVYMQMAVNKAFVYDLRANSSTRSVCPAWVP